MRLGEGLRGLRSHVGAVRGCRSDYVWQEVHTAVAGREGPATAGSGLLRLLRVPGARELGVVEVAAGRVRGGVEGVGWQVRALEG